jgi:hypothetical protein
MEDPRHALNKLTQPYQWLRREAISNLRIMQALGRPRMARKVLTPWQDKEPECSTRSDAEVQPPMQDTSLISESEGSRGGDADRKKTGLAEKLARHHAACYVEMPWYEGERALAMLTNWFDERTMEWLTDRRACSSRHTYGRRRDWGGRGPRPWSTNAPSSTWTTRTGVRPASAPGVATYNGHVPRM